MRLVFAGTPDPAVPSLRLLAASAHEIAAVLTRTDAPTGRKRVLTASPVAAAAHELGLPTIKANRLDADPTAHIAQTQPDLGVIVAYGGLVREPLLSIPRLGWINLHFSLLPRWRGAAPVQHALIAGDQVTGASVFQLVAALDAGDIFAERRYLVPAGATAGIVLSDLAEVGADLLLEVIDALEAGTAQPTPQTGEVTLAPKLGDDDGRIRWHDEREAVLARVRGVTPEPGAHTSIEGTRLKVLEAHPASESTPPLPPGVLGWFEREVVVGTATSPIVLDRVQPAGRSSMRAADWWRGRQDSAADATVRADA